MRKAPTVIMSSADVAREIGVSRNNLSNMLKRHADYPLPSYTLQDGRLFWTRGKMAEWRRWHKDRARQR